MMAMMTMSQAQMKRPGRNSVAALTRRSRSWIRPDNAEPLRWFRGRYTQWITMQYTESVIVRVGARWTLTPTHAWQEVIAWFSSIPGDQLRSRLIRLITRRSRFHRNGCNGLRLSDFRATSGTTIHVDERHRQHAPDSIFGILVPSEPYESLLPSKELLPALIRDPQPKTSFNTALHVELTSDVEWIPTPSRSLAEEDVLDSEDEEEITNLRARRLKVLHSKATKQKIKSCMQVLASQFPSKCKSQTK
ncbi:hypothetical protein MHU86_17897 [Fragilaria crotonensis]|nr:hypothetical protein MHU86_17897 [Fragilaria crotonensis]